MSILGDSLAKGLKHVTRDFTAAKHRAGRRGLSQRDIAWLRARQKQERRETIKKATWKVMEQAYMLASDNGRLPANARQIMYAARPLVLAITGDKCWDNSQYFTQHLLPDYMEENADETADWDVAFDARGHLNEPHTKRELGLGTLEVRQYIASWHHRSSDRVDFWQMEIPDRWESHGPDNRYKFALFIEKEGFNSLIQTSRLRERFDIMTFSSKGMSTTSSRQLVEQLSENGVTILVAHDFDLSGLTIAYTLGHDTRRYRFVDTPKVIDIGLRLKDVQNMRLQSEPVEIRQIKDPRHKFEDEWDEYNAEYDVTNEELNFLVEKPDKFGRHWLGKRVELNAMTSAQMIAWLERKFEEHGVTKVIPDQETLAIAWQRARRIALANRTIPEILKKINEEESPPPADLAEQVHQQLTAGNALSWDGILADMAKQSLPNPHTTSATPKKEALVPRTPLQTTRPQRRR